MIKKLCGFLLVLIISFNCLSLVSFADSDSSIDSVPQTLYKNSMADIISFEDSASFDTDDFHDYLLSEFKKNTKDIFVYDYKIPTSAYNALNTYVRFSFPEAFNINTNYTLGASATTDGYIYTISPTYLCTNEQYLSLFAQFKERANVFLEGVKDSDMYDYQKALILHDRLVSYCDYDGSLVHAFDIYGALVDGKAVCNGYASAYMYLLNEVGIKNYLCSSDILKHIWNIVLIDGEYYHVDTTWDDYSYATLGTVDHTNFLVSTDKLRETHMAYDYDEIPTSIRFDNTFWQDVHSEFLLIDDTIYFIDWRYGKLNSWNAVGMGETLFTVDDTWTTSDNHYYEGCYSKLSTDGTNLFFSTKDKIFEYNLETHSVVEIFKDTTTKDGYWIYGLSYKNGTVYYQVYSKPSYNENDVQITKAYQYIKKTYTLEVINGVLSYLCNGEVYTDYSGVLNYGKKSYLVIRGIVDCSDDNIIILNGVLYHILNGEIPTNEAPTLIKYNNVFYYFVGGINVSDTLILYYNGERYFVQDGWVNESGGSFVFEINSHHYFITNGKLNTDEFNFQLQGNPYEYYNRKGIVSYYLLDGTGAQKLTELTDILLGKSEKDFLYDFSSDEELNILDIVCAKKTLANP